MTRNRNMPLGRDTGFSRGVRIFLWVCTILVAVAIFFFSAQDGEQSSLLSDALVKLIISVVDPGFEQLAAIEQEGVELFTGKLVRKAAHFTEFAALGFFIRLLAGSYALRRPTRWSWLAGTLYACTDELHQLFVAARAGMWQDVVLDSCGVLAGVTMAYALLVILGRIAAVRAEKRQ